LSSPGLLHERGKALMRYAIAAVAVSILLLPGGAGAEPYPKLKASVEEFGKKTVNQYRQLHGWSRTVNREATGRHIIFYGMPRPGADRLAKRVEVERSIAKMAGWRQAALSPPAPSYASGGSSGSTSGDVASGAPVAALSGTLAGIADCESHGDPSAIGGGGLYRGKYQFTYETWQSVGGSGDPAAASEQEQDARAAALLARDGAGHWPTCGG
jgi:hypothetical protein